MRNTQQFSITLPNEMAKQIEKKVESGAYASVSEVVREGIRTLLDRDISLEKWLKEEVVPGIEEYRANPSAGIPSNKIKQRVREMSARLRDKRPAYRSSTLCLQNDNLQNSADSSRSIQGHSEPPLTSTR
jgi:antitoxin ParD1/3/4